MAKLGGILASALMPLAVMACTQTAGGPPPGQTAAQGLAYCTTLATLYSEYVGDTGSDLGTVYDSGEFEACMDKALTFGEVDTLSQALAAWLQSRGLKRGARVAIMMPNVLQYPVALAAVLRAGLIAVNVNPLYTARELAHQL